MLSPQQKNGSPIPAPDWALRGRFAYGADGWSEGAVLVREEKIVGVVKPEEIPWGCPVEDVGDRFILRGLVDTHVHINEPGRTEWEGFETATRAAAAGGITTLVDMPLNSSPATTTLESFQEKLAAAKGKLWVDCGFYGGVVPGNAEHIEPLIAAGVLGFKAFLCPSGIDEFPSVTEADLRLVMPKLAAARLPLLVHAELMSPLAPDVGTKLATDPRSYAAYLASRPRQWEHQAIELLIRLCREYNCPVHIVHLSSADALPMIDAAQMQDLPLTVETCPHYLYFASEEIPNGDPRFKCAPPIRERENRDRLWHALENGPLDFIASDHSPVPPGMKELATGNLKQAWGGIASLQLSLSIVWTAGRRYGAALSDLDIWLSSMATLMVNLESRKGEVERGFDADLVVFDPEAEFIVTPEMLHHRHKTTPYEGHTLRGRVDRTYLRGRKIYDAGTFSDTPSGQVILRPASGFLSP